jgi:16S rRNA U1498 N3-methylase RsmE
MKLEEAYDRWERIARLVCENAKRSAKTSREQTKQLKAYVDAVTAHNVAAAAMEEHPQDLNRKVTLLEAKEVLNRAREALKNTLTR